MVFVVFDSQIGFLVWGQELVYNVTDRYLLFNSFIRVIINLGTVLTSSDLDQISYPYIDCNYL